MASSADAPARTAAGALYVIATPIGNLSDISARALDTLRAADLIAAEDTRNTRGLLQHFGIAGKLVPLHEHNEEGVAQGLLDKVAGGISLALVSDAGTPGISDPGGHLVAGALAQGIRVIPIPGPSAVATALSAAGCRPGPFLFLGFLPAKSSARRRALEAVSTLPWTLVIYEAPHRIVESLTDLSATLEGERRIVIARELTKMFESIHACPLRDAPGWAQGDPNRQRGEFVLVVDGAPVVETGHGEEETRVLKILLEELSVSDAVRLAMRLTGGRKNELYTLALGLQGE